MAKTYFDLNAESISDQLRSAPLPVYSGKSPSVVVAPSRIYKVSIGQNTAQVPLIFATKGYRSFSAVITNTGVSNTFWFEGSNDLVKWVLIIMRGYPFDNVGQVIADNSLPTTLMQNCNYKFVRLFRGAVSASQMNTITVNLSDTPIVPNADNTYGPWSAASASKTDTSAVTVRAAQSASRKNAISYISISNSGTGAAKVSLLDGAGGSILWVKSIPPGGSAEYTYPKTIDGTVGTLMQMTVSGASFDLQYLITGVTK